MSRPSGGDFPGPLADWLSEAGAGLTIVDPAATEVSLDAAAGVLCVGDPDDGTDPSLAVIRRLLTAAHGAGKPILAIGFGAVLLTEALGGRVRPGHPEVGTGLIAKRDLAADDPLFARAPMTPDVLQFHQDEITLPPGAVLLASSPQVANQAFRVGAHTYGLRFHIGEQVEALSRWAADDPELAALAAPRHFDEEHLRQTQEYIEQAWRPVVERFVALTAGTLAPAGTSRTLPLVP